jgi:hypothetical protein
MTSLADSFANTAVEGVTNVVSDTTDYVSGYTGGVSSIA